MVSVSVEEFGFGSQFLQYMPTVSLRFVNFNKVLNKNLFKALDLTGYTVMNTLISVIKLFCVRTMIF